MDKNFLDIDYDSSWEDFLTDDVKNFISIAEGKYDDKTSSPGRCDVLRFMKQNLLEVKYVLYGQDPYPRNNGKMVATGRCFEPEGYTDWMIKTPNTSLRNILRAIYGYYYNDNNPSISKIRKQISNNSFNIPTPPLFFDNLEKQGLLLLNYGLTILKNPGDQLDLWDDFQKRLLMYLYKTNPDIVYIIWGNKVYDLIIGLQERINKENNINMKLKLIQDCHPARNGFVTNNNTFKNTPDIKWG